MPDNFDNEKTYNYDSTSKSQQINDTTPSHQSAASATENVNESSYEWNSTANSAEKSSSEYHYSYVNGNNFDAAHNPNRYGNAASNYSYDSNAASSSSNKYSESDNQTNNDYGKQSYSSSNTQQGTAYSGYSNTNPYSSYNNQYGYAGQSYSQVNEVNKPKKIKKPHKPASKGFVAAMVVVSMVLSAALGFGGGFFASRIGKSSGGLYINQVAAENTSTGNEALNGTTTGIVKKVADSVVEIKTEKVVTGGFLQQYVQQGAGSGVIISDDGYIITNNHVISGASNITVTLRDGTTSYTAALIGTDEDEDIALIKVDATGLTPSVFGDSSKLLVGDYVVAIGNPLGELGGTVTDGIVSALAREVKIEGNSMTLLQHNAQISPGNSGGGLFNANGELIGIVNAKDSATEVEGIAFAIPVNNVLDIISDLKTYGYVTGRVDLGLQLTDITSRDTAFFYGVNKTGCYVMSVTKGSNAEKAGFKTGDLIVKVNNTEVTTSDDIESALKDSQVGDKVNFTVYRSGKNTSIDLTLEEYIPSNTKNNTNQQNHSGESIWDDMFNW